MGIPPRVERRRREWLADPVSTGWNIVETSDDGDVVGHVGVAPATSRSPMFAIFVADDHRNAGTRTELVRQTIAHAPEYDHDELQLTVDPDNERAITVYRNVDFEVTEHNPMDLPHTTTPRPPIVREAHQPPAER